MTDLAWARFRDELAAIQPSQAELAESTVIDDLSPLDRIAVRRFLAEYLDRPTDLGVIAQIRTIGDAWAWARSSLSVGDARRVHPALASSASSRLSLRPVRPADYPSLFEASFDVANSTRWRFRGATMTYDEFVATADQGVRCQYMVDDVHTGETYGLVSCYEHNQAGLHCKVAFLRTAAADARSSGAVFEGLIMFLGVLFRSFPYRKIFAEVPTFNRPLLEAAIGRWLTEEGCLREYFFHDGVPADLHLLSISRSQWLDLVDAWSGVGDRPTTGAEVAPTPNPRSSSS